MLIIVGLGNPGNEYAKNYHNMGYMTVAKLAEQLGVKLNTKECKALCGIKFNKGDKVVLALPTTFMNGSGECVRELLGKYQSNNNDMVVIYDDIDLPVGDIRIRKEGSAGTHNGMKSIIDEIKCKEFIRIRMGIGKPKGEQDLKDFVLSNLSKTDKPILDSTIDNAVTALVEYINSRDIDAIMRKYN